MTASDPNPTGSAGAALAEGARFGGTSGTRFVVEAEIGRGGQAVVYRTRDTRLDRLVALKLCTAPEGYARKMFLDRFERELQLTSRVSHPHVLQVYDAGELPGGAPFVLLEWMEHGSLVDMANAVRKTGKHLPMEYLRYYATAMAAGLRACHSAEVIHRDVKPDNVLIARDGVAKVTDFGVALDISPDADRLTEVGQTVGTLGFMSPEQLAGLPGPQSDIFSFGVTVYALITGRLPEQEVTSNRIPTGDIKEAAWGRIPDGLQAMFQRICAYDLKERCTSFDEVLTLVGEADWSEPTDEHRMPAGKLPPLPTGAYVSGQTGVLPVSASGEALNPTPLSPSDPDMSTVGADTLGFDDTIDLTVQPPINSQIAAEIASTEMEQDALPNVNSADATSVDRSEVRLPSPNDVATRMQPAKPAKRRRATRAKPDTTESDASLDAYPLRRGPNKLLLGLAGAALLVVGIVVVSVLAGGPGEQPSADEMVGHLDRYARHAGAGEDDAADRVAQNFGAVLEDDPHVQVLLAVDAFMVGDHARARSIASLHAGRADPVGAHASLVLAALERTSSPDGYAASIAHYQQAANCAGELCGEARARAAIGLRDACLAAPGGAAGCEGVAGSLSGRSRHLTAGLVLHADGHASAASSRVQMGLAEPLNGTPSCAEAAALRAWGETPAVPAELLQPLADARRAAARSASDCALFAESP